MTASIACPDRGDLERLALGQVIDAEAERLGQHVLNCSACAELLNSIQTGDPLLFELTRVAGQDVINHLDNPTADALVKRLVGAPPGGAAPATPSGSATETQGLPAGDEPLPDRLGRYRIIDRLGAGGMGMVCRAHDPQLGRDVAIKVPSFGGPADARAAARQRFVREARAAAAVRHANVCPIYDVGEDAGRPYVVMALVEGESLADRLRREERFADVSQASTLVAQVADALATVHAAGIVHRDLKPGNILLDRAGQPYLADFGLAHLMDSEPLTCPGMLMGTPAYMSPEQANGEGHRVDGRSDIFSLGAVLYQLLTGKRPFDGSVPEVLARIVREEPAPLREIDRTIPQELERICLKALSRRASDRYSSAKDMADDLRHFLASHRAAGSTSDESPSAAERRPLKIVPKGLRSFEAYDADFFLELLPGPRDRDGLPDSIRFWKSRIEAADDTFRVGLIYGPSGCGKSSLVKAGLLPVLAGKVHALYIEATADETETRLLAGLRKRFSTAPANLTLKETLEALRRGRGIPAGDKVLIVLDQFEQWLHARQEYDQSELVRALRQCDGGRVQCIIMVRDDFWMAATRLMRELEVRLVEGHNSAAVDLFDTDHAKKVLTAFGRAFERLPEGAAQMTDDQRQFIQQALAGVAQDGKVICVHLSLFAEMMKGKAWTPNTLKEVGGTEGVGVAFLEETFSASTAPAEHRYCQRAARAVLKALLPEAGTEIKGHMRSGAQLLAASGYARRPGDCDALIDMLDRELRLITPTDPEGTEPEANQPNTIPADEDATSRDEARPKCYQLTHDYLVPSIREWLTRKQKETWRGRAELRLAERSRSWNAKPENRHLPALWEFMNIRGFTRKARWTDAERKLMQRAGRYHAIRSCIVAASLVLLAFLAGEIQGNITAKNFVQRLLTAKSEQVPGIVDQLASWRKWADPLLRAAVADGAEGSSAKLRASMGLLPVDAGQAGYLQAQALEAQPEGEGPLLVKMLADYRSQAGEALWSVWDDRGSQTGRKRLRAACLLAALDPSSERWQAVRSDVASQLVLVNASDLGEWKESLRGVARQLVPPLAELFDRETNVLQQSLAAAVLADYAQDDKGTLAMVLASADDNSFHVLLPVLRKHGEAGATELQRAFAAADRETASLRRDIDRVEKRLAEIENDATERANRELVRLSNDTSKLQQDLDRVAKRQANLAVALLEMGLAQQAWALLRFPPVALGSAVNEASGDPRLRSYLIHRFAPLDASAQSLVMQLGREKDDSIRQALILALGTFNPAALTDEQRASLVSQLLQIYEHDADAGVHGAADWLLRKWQHDRDVQALDEKLKDKNVDERIARHAKSPRGWFINSQGQTFTAVRGPLKFKQGSPLAETPRRDTDEQQREVLLSYSFAIGAKKVTVAEFERFLRENPDVTRVNTQRVAPDREPADSGPQVDVNWHDAARYCNWLSGKDGIPSGQCCYEAAEGSKGQMKPVDDFLKRRGYRLPTEAEWEYACRAGATTARYYGETDELLDQYAWFAGQRTHGVGLLKPNGFGLFDILGNAYDWNNDWYGPYDTTGLQRDPTGPAMTSSRVLRGGSWSREARVCRCACRYGGIEPGRRMFHVGFRLAAVQ